MNIIENNKLIAEFMGVEDREPQYSNPEYKNDWNYLMPVVEKIESLGYIFHIDSNAYYNDEDDTVNYSRIQQTALVLTPGRRIVINSADHRDSKILAVYYACVKFIQWHNQKTK